MKRLVKFCHEKNIYPQVLYYIHLCDWGNNPKNSINMWKKVFYGILHGNDYALMFFDYAFSWTETKQGHDFWEKISTEWKKYCSENNVKELKL